MQTVRGTVTRAKVAPATRPEYTYPAWGITTAMAQCVVAAAEAS
jgi:hypothetical protein